MIVPSREADEDYEFVEAFGATRIHVCEDDWGLCILPPLLCYTSIMKA